MPSSSRTALLSAREGSNGVAPHSAFDLRTQVMVAAKPCEHPKIEQSCVIWQAINRQNSRARKTAGKSPNARLGLKGRRQHSLISSDSTFPKAALSPFRPEGRNSRRARAAPEAAA